MSMGIASAFAASITIERDSSYQTGDSGNGNVYKYYKVFSASYTANESTGGGSTDGVPGAVTGTAEAASYQATSAVAAKLGRWVDAVPANPEATPPTEAVPAHWEKATGNTWFDLTPIAGSTNYSVTWAGSATPTADEVQAAAAWLIEKGAYEAGPTALSFADGKWTSGTIDAGYYLVEGATGKNLVAATSDININEKNTYPPQDKTQADEDNTTKNDAERNVAVGDVLSYDVTVTIPATAKVGDKILVYDKNSQGLTYNSDSMQVTNTAKADVGTADYTGTGAVTGAAWQRLITVDEDTVLGSTVVFSFTMTVNESALVDTDKENESGLKYGPGSGETPWPYESKPDKVEYKTYFAGIEKVDGKDASIKLKDVEFTLKEGNAEFPVKLVTDAGGKDYYIYDASGSSTVTTDANGLIRIRGLDADKTYTLTETKNPNAGYNMLADPVTLSLFEDTTTTTTYAVATEFVEGTTYYTKNGDNYVVAEVADATAFAAGTFYTASTSSTSSYNGTTADTWQDVVNNKGTLLPSTGGIGTTIFYVVGSILVVAAGVLLITKKRMSREG